MAAITRIQVANFLSDGYIEGKEWVPLYRGETFRLFGRSSALQIDNGGGKTSLTESCLYLLSRDRRLKPKVVDRVAPVDNGWTHIRIEFTEKPHDENILQRDLITEFPEDVPGISYVVGMTWNRGKDPNFYQYQGFLEDAPCFQKEPNRLQLVDNDTFRKSVERMPGARWNKWRNQHEWLDEIRQFTNVEVIKQNVEFQLEGAGDYSAMVNKVKAENGESYDAAFFRQFVAPELLRQPLGAEGDSDEQHFEDTLFKHLKPTADALVDISMRQRELDDAKAALIKFEPVEARAKEVIEVNTAYEAELASVVRNAAVIHVLAIKNPVPGMPKASSVQQWSKDNRLLEALSCLVIDKREGVLIKDEGLACLIGISTGKLNEVAFDRRVEKRFGVSQPIDLTGDIKSITLTPEAHDESSQESQQTDLTGDIKRHGGRRKDISYYTLESARDLVGASANLQGAGTTGLPDILTRAFGIAMDEIDTNPYRREQRDITQTTIQADQEHKKATSEHESWSAKYESLLRESRDTKENEVAYETFKARLHEFLAEHQEAPLDAKAWAELQLQNDRTALEQHNDKIRELTGGHRNWQQLNEKHMAESLQDVLVTLIGNHDEATAYRDAAQKSITQARNQRDGLHRQYQTELPCLEAKQKQHERLVEFANAMPRFHELFGDADPENLNPTNELQEANKSIRAKIGELKDANTLKTGLEGLKPTVKLFRQIFGEIDPSTLYPTKDLLAHTGKITVEQSIISDHQPFIEALSEFHDTHPGMTPDDWVSKTEEQRDTLLEEQRGNRSRIQDIRDKVTDLDSYALADDRVYAKALAVLGASEIVFDRLHALVSEIAGDKREALLTLFSAALSAPVVNSLDEADRATQILEDAELTVPVFLKEPLKEFIHSGDYKLSGKLAHSFLVGRRTRQVEILLDPKLIEEEKRRLSDEMTVLENRNKEVGVLLKAIAPGSPAVILAIKARDAIQRKSEGRYQEALKALDQLTAASAELERRAARDAVESISATKKFLAGGGDQALNTLLDATIPQLEFEKQHLDGEITRLQGLVTEEASRMLHDAKDFKKAGGEDALRQIAEEIGRLAPLVEKLKAILDELDSRINGILTDEVSTTESALANLNGTFSIDKRDLDAAITFESAGHLAFMTTAAGELTDMTAHIDKSIARLQGIDFDRAEKYILSTKKEERSVVDKLAEAESNRNQAKEQKEAAEAKLTNLRGRLATILPFVDDLHDAVIEIRGQYVKIATFSDDIRQRMASAGNVHPDILKFAEDIDLACMGKQPSTSTETRAAIANLRESVKALGIDTRPLQQLSREKRRTQDDFKHKRNEFCEKARNGEIKGLQLPEIERIAEAQTIDQLTEIHQIKDKIDVTIREHLERLQMLRETMETNKAATVDNLARFARQAETNLHILDGVMKKTPNARFFVDAKVANQEKIRQIIESLIAEIQDREQAARERNSVALNEEIERRNRSYRELIHSEIYRNIFSEQKILFSHMAIRDGEKYPFTDKGGLSTGQITALMMMWLIKQAEYALTRVALMYGTRKEQKAALRGAQRIMFFDGLFSNLTNEDYINHAFQGLRDVDDNFQLIGLIHNPYYVNNKEIFPVHLVAKRKLAKKGDMQRVFMAVEPWQEDNGVILYTSAYRHDQQPDPGNA